MSYTHIRNDRGVIHAVPDDGGEWTVCGKETPHNYDEVTDPVSCKVCLKSIRSGWVHRQLHDLTALAQEITYEADGYVLPDRLTEIIGQFENVLNRKKPS